MQTAFAYQMKDRWLVNPMWRTTTGLLVGGEPIFSLPLEVEDDILGSTLVKALARPAGVLQHPRDWKRHALPRLAAAGVKSEKAFQLQSRLVSVSKTAQGTCLEPTRNGGASGSGKGFEVLTDSRIYVSLDEGPESLGFALKQTVKSCVP